MSGEKQVQIIMVSAAFQGHLNPKLNFAKRLVLKGARVTLISTDEARDGLIKSNALTRLNSDPNIQLEFFSDGLSLDFDRSKDAKSFMGTLETEGAKNLSNLITLLSRDRKYSCMIVTAFLPWASEIAVAHSIPCAMLFFQASALYSIYYSFANKMFSPNFENPDETVEIPGLPEFQVRDLPTFILPSCPRYHSKLVWDTFRFLVNMKWVLGVSVYEFEEDIVNSMASLAPILPIGPVVSPFLLGEKESDDLKVDLWNAEDSCLEWLDKKLPSSVIYVAFGSLLVLSQKEMDNIAMALKNSNRAFLWVIRPTKNGGQLPSGFLEETEGRGQVVSWCPQEKVLAHPAVACFVSHCGWNSTLEELVAGVPVIGRPNWSDQPTNAKLVADIFKNGVKMRLEEDGIVSREEVERCITEVMEGPKADYMKKRALELKATAKKALADGGSSDRNINQFLSEIVQQFTST
ncbi:hypothetical protein L6164_027864 [Bauhinia variegata]|uniref:Uncharacterized protein n=1 Tax=Bauhinia variegata TaxID=167791 RepID=A0ACB9LVD4_BAUVA|nr:hypothetical protein L6164_027864 [Bauhinia variegata]